MKMLETVGWARGWRCSKIRCSRVGRPEGRNVITKLFLVGGRDTQSRDSRIIDIFILYTL